MAEKWTKTYSPVERWINPYPFAPLNHFTVPFSLTDKTPFTNREELLLPESRIAPRSTEAPLREAGWFFRLRLRCVQGITSKKEKTPQFLIAVSGREEPLESDNLACFPLHPTNVNHFSGFTSGQLTGCEQRIILSIKTFRKQN